MTDWKKFKVGEIADVFLGKMLNEKTNKGDLFPYLANINVRWGEFDLSSLREMRFESHEIERYSLRAGDIVMCEGGEPGRCAIWKDDDQKMMFQKAIHRIRSRAGVDSNFLYYSFLNKRRTNGFSPLFTGSTIKHLPKQNLELVEILIPPLTLQHRITDVLSAYDDLIENNHRRIVLLEDAARQLYREWFVRLRFPGLEHTRIMDGVPDGWERKKLGDLCSEMRENVEPNEIEPDTPYIGLEHMPRRSISLADWGRAEHVTSTKHKFNAGDILFGKIRPYFHKVGIAFVDGIASSDAIVIRPYSSALHSFILMTVSSDAFVAFTSQTVREGSKMPRADWKVMQQYPVHVPRLGLLETFNANIGTIVEQLKTLNFQNQRARAARDILLPRLMNGEIAV